MQRLGVITPPLPGAKSLSFFMLDLCYDVPEMGHGRVGPQVGKEDNQDNVGNEEEVDTEEVNVEKVVTTGMRRRMRRWSTRSPRKNHLFLNISLYLWNCESGCGGHESCERQ